MTRSSKMHKQSSRPYVIINCAMSIDGKIALPSKKPIKLSSLEDFKRVHQLRNYCDAVLVGIGAVLMDDPKLTVKSEFVIKPHNPIRIILDTRGRTPKYAQVLDGKAPTIIVMGERYKEQTSKFTNVEVIHHSIDTSGNIELSGLLTIFKEKGIENLLVEGGSTVIYNFLKDHLVDELFVYISNKIVGGMNTPTLASGEGAKTINDVMELTLYEYERLGDGLVLKYLANK